mmetsp:Transcript_5823/g.15876  ORF Transcript_5823/g.15876 Transcript_5823/m.15876 type:complete len:223 (+) Transcript_5823:86-754(+)
MTAARSVHIAAVAQLREHSQVVRTLHAQRLPDGLSVRSQEGVCVQLEADGGGHCGLARGTHVVDFVGPCYESWVVGIHAEAEACVGLRILVRAEDEGLRGQAREALERLLGHGGCTFKEAATAEGKERVAHECHLLVWEVEGDVSRGVPRYVDHVHASLAQLQRVTTLDTLINAGNTSPVRFGGNNLAPKLRLELQVAPRVVIVVVRVENMCEGPPGLLARA